MRKEGVVAQLKYRLSLSWIFLHCTGNKSCSFGVVYRLQFDVFVDLNRTNSTILLRSLS